MNYNKSILVFFQIKSMPIITFIIATILLATYLLGKRKKWMIVTSIIFYVLTAIMIIGFILLFSGSDTFDN